MIKPILSLLLLVIPAQRGFAATGSIYIVQSIGVRLPILSLTQSAGTATATVSSTANLTTGATATVANADSAYDGTVTITVANSTQFTFPVAAAANSPSLTAGANVVQGYSVTITQTAGVATGTVANTGGLVTGGQITIAGANQSGFNGTFPIVVNGATTFTFPVASSLAATATGTITALPVPTTLFGANGDGLCSAFAILDTDQSNAVIAAANGMHVSGGLPIPANGGTGTATLRAGVNAIKTVTAASLSPTATVTVWGGVCENGQGPAPD